MPDLSRLELSDPLLLLFGLLAPFVYLQASRLAARVRYSSLGLVDVGRSLRARLVWLPPALHALAALALSVALAGPRTGESVSEVRREGIAIAMVVDRSGSMEARDFVRGDASISRLDVVKRIFRDFVAGGGPFGEGRPDDLIGLVGFARYADGLCPLTLDHGHLLAMLEDLETPRASSEDGTAVGEGLALAVERLRRQETASRIAILLTDGVNNAGEIEPLQAAELAASLGIKVYTVGAGSTGIAPMPARTLDGRTVLRPRRVEIDEATLARIAERTEGRYFNAKSAEGLIETYAEIDQLERTEITEIRYLQYREHYPWFVLAALALIALASVAAGTVLRRLP